MERQQFLPALRCLMVMLIAMLSSTAALAQTKLTGQVVDGQDEPVAGATVMELGTKVFVTFAP